jgi:transcriptional regulator with XRE-family HTH domain
MRDSVRERVAGAVRAEIARQRCGRAALADAIGVSRATIDRRLAGDQEFTVTELQAAADFLGVSLTKLLGEPEPSGDRAVAS